MEGQVTNIGNTADRKSTRSMWNFPLLLLILFFRASSQVGHASKKTRTTCDQPGKSYGNAIFLEELKCGGFPLHNCLANGKEISSDGEDARKQFTHCLVKQNET